MSNTPAERHPVITDIRQIPNTPYLYRPYDTESRYEWNLRNSNDLDHVLDSGRSDDKDHAFNLSVLSIAHSLNEMLTYEVESTLEWADHCNNADDEENWEDDYLDDVLDEIYSEYYAHKYGVTDFKKVKAAMTYSEDSYRILISNDTWGQGDGDWLVDIKEIA